ncbi:MAG: metallophosphoesterase family protein [Lachnospiraceae bacterium]|nr:metallophosphoesterase family protein [Lachnospiraceae bacterium]
MRYYISDLHFYHDALNHVMDERGFRDEQDMNEFMIHQWNSRVRKNDEVVVLGDLSMEKWDKTKEILDQLKGKIYLIQGNHDRFIKDKDFDASRFIWVRSYAEMHDNGRKIILSHYPVLCYNGQNRLRKHGNPKTYMLHGHVHDTLDQRLLEQFQQITRSTMRGDAPIPCNLLNCFCMYSQYVPLGLDEWIEYHENKIIRRD